jgi:hypothetical protein
MLELVSLLLVIGKVFCPDGTYFAHKRRRRHCNFREGKAEEEDLVKGVEMDISTFEMRLAELLNEISDSPAEQSKKLLALAQKMSRKQETHSPGETLDQLRLTVKYLLFDLEATRRENKYLRKMLEHNEE